MDFSTVPTLSGSRVTLEPLAESHAAELASAVGELWRTWYTTVPKPEGMAAEIGRRLALRDSGSMLPFAVLRNDTGAAVGMSTFMNLDPASRRLEIGSTWLAKSAQRTGINTEAKLLLLGHAFETLSCIAVEFRTHWHNLQSRRAIAELGAKQDGVLRNHQLWRDGSLRDTVVFSIIESEWPVVRLSLTERLAAHVTSD
jgi:RimJ/RimL family protein N-acetyltransferase